MKHAPKTDIMARAPDPNELKRELDRILTLKSAVIRRLIMDDHRVDVLARVCGYEVFPFHWLLMQMKEQMPGSWKLFLAPRGSGKSTILTIVWSVADALWDRNIRILLGSRVKDQAKDMLTEVQGCFEGERFVELFGDLRGEKWGTGEATIAGRTKKWKEPTWLAAGADGPVTSKHFDIIRLDDLVDEKNARTEGERQKIYTFVYKTLTPTLLQVREDGSPGMVEVVGTRYHPQDIYAHMIDVDPNFGEENVCEIPALVDPETGEMSYEGISVVPEILPTQTLKGMKVAMGSANFDTQYQQSTKRMQGDIFKADCFRYYDAPESLEQFIAHLELKIWAACDLAIGEKELNDEYADVVIGVDDRDAQRLDVYLLNLFHGRIPYTAQIARAEWIFDTFDPIRFGIEANAFQKERLHSVYRELGGEIGDRCIPVITLVDKVTRAWKLSARYEAGRIHHPKEALWLDAFELQMTGFPKLKHDDMFDALDIAVTLGCVMRARKKRKRSVGIIGGDGTVTRQGRGFRKKTRGGLYLPGGIR